MANSAVKLIVGPAKSGKTERVLQRYAAALDAWRRDPSGAAHVWIGPTPAALNDVRDRLALRAAGGWLNPRILTFTTLAQEIVSAGSRRVRPISALEKQRVLSHVIERLLAGRQLTYFAAVARTPGFLRQAAAAIADLKRRDVWAEEFRKRGRGPRDQGFALIYAAYQEHLQRHQLFDTEGRFWAAREELESHPTTRLDYGLIVLDGFDDFTAAQHELLRLLARHCQELLITLPADGNAQPRELLFDKPRRTLAQLERSFPQFQCEATTETHFSMPGLAAVERNIFRDDARPAAAADGLSIVAANGVQSEIREVARRVKDLLLTGSARPSEIAVVFPTVEELAPRIVEVFDDFGLPLALESRPRLSATPLVRGLVSLLRLVIEDWPFEGLVAVVGNRSISLFSGEVDLRAAVERCIRRAQLPAGRLLLLEQLREWARKASSDLDPDASTTVARLAAESQVALDTLSRLDEALSNLDGPASVTDWIARLESVLTRTGVLTTANAPLWQLLAKQFQLISEIDQQFEADARALDAGEFLALCNQVADAILLPRAADDVGRVRVLSAEQARNLAVRHLFLAGLSEQSYSSAETAGSLYREAEILRFTDTGANGNVALQQSGEAMLLFYDMVTRPSETLTLSYAALDEKGQTLTPSPYLTELERCFDLGSIPVTAMPAGVIDGSETAPASRSDWRTHGMVAAVEGKREWLAGLVATGATRSLGRAILRSVQSVASRSEREVFGPFEGLLMGDSARAVIANRFGSDHLWSPSQLETYAACPYQFFARQVLKLEPLDDIALRSDHLRKGQLLHQVLAAVHTQQPEADGSLDEQRLLERFTTALARFIAENPLKGLEDALREIERREIYSWAPAYAEQETAYRQRWAQFDEPLAPAYFEVRFGPKARGGDSVNDAVSVAVPFTLDLGAEKIKLTGQIDRVDMGRVGGVTVFNIIDYKSGKEVKLADGEIAAGRQLQLPLYALAAEELLFADRQARALATGYWSIQAGGFAPGRDSLLEFRTPSDGGLVDSPRWSELSTALKQRVGEIVRGVRSAHFPIYSDDQNCTRYCEFSKMCRIAQIRSLEKAWIADSGVFDVKPKK